MGDRAKLAASVRENEHDLVELRQNQNMLRGSLATIRDVLQRAQRDLNNPNYREIDDRYRKQLIELKTNEMATADLDKYHKVRFEEGLLRGGGVGNERHRALDLQLWVLL